MENSLGRRGLNSHYGLSAYHCTGEGSRAQQQLEVVVGLSRIRRQIIVSEEVVTTRTANVANLRVASERWPVNNQTENQRGIQERPLVLAFNVFMEKIVRTLIIEGASEHALAF